MATEEEEMTVMAAADLIDAVEIATLAAVAEMTEEMIVMNAEMTVTEVSFITLEKNSICTK